MKIKNVEDVYSLSPMQQGMLFHSLYSPDSGMYFEQLSCTLNGDLNVSAFQGAWQRVVERHPVLRTAFIWEGLDEALQVVRQQVKVPWEQHDWRAFSPIMQREQLKSFLQADRERGFDLSVAPLMRLTLLQVDENAYHFIWSYHHLLLDGWCLSLLLKEVFALYKAFSQGQDLHLVRSRPYRDYIAWLQQQNLSQAEAFWRQALKGFTAPTPLVVGKAVGNLSSQQESYDEQQIQLSAATTQALQSFAQHHQLTLNTLVQGAWVLLLSRYSGQEDVVFGATVSGRPADLVGVESMVGLFINTLPVRVLVSPQAHLVQWLQQLQAQQVELRQYEYSPLVQVQGWSEVPRGLPLFESIVVFENYPIDASLQQGGSLEFRNVRALERTNYPLTLAADPGAQLSLQLSYDCRRFDADTITRMLEHFQILLEGIVADPKQGLSDLPMLTAKERQQLLVEWNHTQVDYPKDVCIHQLFEAQVERTPDAVAIVFEDQQLTYGELNRRANCLAHYLRSLGVGPDTLAGICVERSLEMVVGLLGILKAGGAYVPLDPAYPSERLAFMLKDAQVPVLLTQQQLLEKLPEHQAHVVCLNSDWEFIAQHSQENPNSGVTTSNLAYTIYTSGSTGQPKGTMLSHRALCNHMFWMSATWPLSQTDRVLQKTAISFDASIWEFYAPLLAGAQLIMARPEGHKDSGYLVEAIAKHKVTVLQLVPSMLQVLLSEPQLQQCDSLQRVYCGGEALSVELQQRFGARLGAELYNLYGPTEACIDATWWACEPESKRRTVPIGRPIANTEIYLLDQCLQPVPIGVPGEMYIGGAGLARGYLNRPELTAERFIPNPFSQEPGARLYKTGDMARYLSDGNIEYLGRLDDQVKLRGFRIQLGEIEAVLSQHPAVQQSVVMVREDVPSNKRLVAYVVTKEAPAPTISELQHFLKQKLPEYMVPTAIVLLEALPLTPNGKVDRRALPAPDTARPEESGAYVAPRTSVESVLALIWAEVLGVENVGIHDNFFELGGDSILSIQIVARANQAGLALTPKQLFQYQTIASLATVVGSSQVFQTEQGLVTGEVVLTPIQRWFFEQKLPQAHHWNQSMLLEVRQALDLALLQQAVQQLLVHHDALRLRFERSASGWRQVNALPDEVVPCTRVDLSALSESEQAGAIEAKAAEVQASLNLESGPLMRVVLFELGDRQPQRLLWVIHHLVVDGVSWRILLEDLQTAYQQLCRGETIKLPPKTTSFQDWANALSQYAQSAALEQELDYWLACSRSLVAPLPVDYPAGKDANTVVSATHVSVSLSSTQTQALLQEVPKAYHTQINDVLLTALVQAFCQWTGTGGLLVDLEGHGREEIVEVVDVSRTVGWFTTLFPVRLELKQPANPGSALKAIKEQLRSIPNRGIGYGLLGYLRGEATLEEQLQALPQAEVSFNYLGQFDSVLSPDAMFGLAKESSEPERSRLGSRSHLLEVNAFVTGGCLQLNWTYSSKLHQQATIESLASCFMTQLRALIAHCQSPEAGGYTPSDFPLAQLSQYELDEAFETVEFEEV